MTDPWSVQQSDITNGTKSTTNVDNDNSQLEEDSTKSLGFEDSFIAENNNSQLEESCPKAEQENNSIGAATTHQPLPDSQTYLKGLERKLEKLKKSSKLVDALSEKREDCLRSLVQNDLANVGGGHNDLLLELETSLVNSDSAVHNLYRQIQPVQPVTVGETVHIVKFDQLEEQRLELEATAEEEDDLPASR